MCYFIYYIFFFRIKSVRVWNVIAQIRTRARCRITGYRPWVVTSENQIRATICIGTWNIINNNKYLLILYIYLYTHLGHTIRIQAPDIGCRLLPQYINYICITHMITRDIIKKPIYLYNTDNTHVRCRWKKI